MRVARRMCQLRQGARQRTAAGVQELLHLGWQFSKVSGDLGMERNNLHTKRAQEKDKLLYKKGLESVADTCMIPYRKLPTSHKCDVK